MLATLSKIFTAIPVWVYELIFVLLLIGGGLFNGKIQYYRGEHSQMAKEKTAEQKYVQQSQKVTTQVQTVYVDRVKTITTVGQTIIKKVPIYVTKHDDLMCTINTGFVSLWNSANQMSVPSPATSVDETPSAITLSDVANQHTIEATQYNELSEQVIALQSWIQQEQQLK
jgi:hypothetical protein